MIIVLLGKTASGKDYYLNNLVKSNSVLTRVITYTSRPIRSNEKNGVDYYFMPKEEMLNMIDNGDMLEHISYNTVNGEYYYGTHINSFQDDSKNYIVILDVEGYKKVKKIYKNNVKAFYIDRSYKNRKESYLQRDSNSNKKEQEFERRESEDDKKFKGLLLDKSIRIVDNNNFDLSDANISKMISTITKYINKEV